jgi:hypothetical protein
MSVTSRIAAIFRARRLPLAIGAVFFVQIYFFQWHPAYPNPNEAIHIYLVRSIVEHRTFQVDALIKRFGDVEDKSYFEGHNYSNKAPGVAFAALLPYSFARLFGDMDMKTARHVLWLSVVLLPSVLLLIALWRFFAEFGLGEAERSLLILAYGMGSLGYTFSTLLFSHQFASILAMGAFLGIHAFRRGKAGMGRLAFAGLLAGWAVITEYALAIPLFFAFVFLCAGPTWKRAWLFVATASVPVLLMIGYNVICFHNPLEIAYRYLPPGYFVDVKQGFFGVIGPRWDAFVGSFFGTSRGFFYLAPWLLLALPGFFWLLRRPGWRLEGGVALGTLLGYGLFISSLSYWHGGGTSGMRYLTPLAVFLLLPVAEVMRRAQETRSVLVHALLRSLIVIGIVLTIACAVPWPYISPAYANPFPEISLPMWRELILPPSLLEATGLSKGASVAVFLVLVGATLIYVAAGPPGWSFWRRWVHGNVVAAVSILAIFGAERVNYVPEAQAHKVRDRLGIAKLVDHTRRRPALVEEDRLVKAAQTRALAREEKLRLGFLLAGHGDVQGALRWYREAAAAK